ncbi:Na+/H+ antiporter subunit E [Thalassococcus lentus]|uniref:Na+/H+ antiporter subunit E n=1 Tax=Thalassococcus lentus TaxID=1210524 RepID=A0ABT4XQ07_9RHOB|nr:Na+/H+ antiporter subunit E [Thalassococcus lentus]MDA7424021.1 Na+/H+ antiporter subunit E [Thalassococcus lentus]
MSTLAGRILPHPILTLFLTVVWILLQNDFSAGMAVFGLILGIIIPAVTAAWWPDRPRGIKLGKFILYFFLVVWDIIVANVQVAWIVLTRPNSKLRPCWVVVPLELRTPEAIAILAGTITLTPGTVTADLSSEGHSLLVHALDAESPDEVRDQIKDRYERRLKEIFA